MNSQDIAAFFIRNGYFKVPSVLPSDLTSEVEMVLEREFSNGDVPTRLNASGQVCRIDSLIDRDPIFLQTLRHPTIISALTAILGPDIEILRDRHNQATLNKAGDIPFRLHRDVRHWSRPVVSLFVYIDEATTLNGCTHVVPGSHVLPYAALNRMMAAEHGPMSTTNLSISSGRSYPYQCRVVAFS